MTPLLRSRTFVVFRQLTKIEIINLSLKRRLQTIRTTVLAGSQVASGTHDGIYLIPSDIGCQYSDLHCVLHRVATSSCRGHVDELATEVVKLEVYCHSF